MVALDAWGAADVDVDVDVDVDAVDVEVEVADGVVHDGVVMVSASSVTAPLRAKTRPTIVVPVSTVMLCIANTEPWKLDPLPRVAELPTCQKTLHACVPLIRLTWLADAVVSVLVAAWKTNTALGSPPPSSVSVPVKPNEEAELYTPGCRVWPPRSATIGEVGPWLIALL